MLHNVTSEVEKKLVETFTLTKNGDFSESTDNIIRTYPSRFRNVKWTTLRNFEGEQSGTDKEHLKRRKFSCCQAELLH